MDILRNKKMCSAEFNSNGHRSMFKGQSQPLIGGSLCPPPYIFYSHNAWDSNAQVSPPVVSMQKEQVSGKGWRTEVGRIVCRERQGQTRAKQRALPHQRTPCLSLIRGQPKRRTSE